MGRTAPDPVPTKRSGPDTLSEDRAFGGGAWSRGGRYITKEGGKEGR